MRHEIDRLETVIRVQQGVLDAREKETKALIKAFVVAAALSVVFATYIIFGPC